jgi:hypothetical protein
MPEQSLERFLKRNTDNQTKNLAPPSQAEPVQTTQAVATPPAQTQQPTPPSDVSTLPPQSAFDFQQDAPLQQANPDLGFLGNVGTILNVLGGVTQSPELSAVGGGLLGIMKRQQDKEAIEQKNAFALQQFESSKERARQGFELANEFSPQISKIAKLQFQQGDTKGGFATLRKEAGGETALRSLEARIKLRNSINIENMGLAAQDIAAGADPLVALSNRGVKLGKQEQRSVKKQAQAIKDAASGPGFMERFMNIIGLGESQPSKTATQTTKLTEEAAIQNFITNRNRQPTAAERTRIRNAVNNQQ